MNLSKPILKVDEGIVRINVYVITVSVIQYKFFWLIASKSYDRYCFLLQRLSVFTAPFKLFELSPQVLLSISV